MNVVRSAPGARIVTPLAERANPEADPFTTDRSFATTDEAGTAGDDILIGGADADFLQGLEGNDRLIGNAGNDRLFGGDGIDTADYSTATRRVTVNLAIGGFQFTDGGDSDRLDSIENLIGSAFGDTLYGASGANRLDGGQGDDQLYGRRGNDVLMGGDGDDTLNGEDDDDWLDGGAGNDRLDGGKGIDTALYGSATAGVTVTLAQRVQATGGAGTDTLIGIENLSGSGFADLLTGNAEANTLSDAIGGSDRLRGGRGDDLLIGLRSGGGAADTLTLDGGDDIDRVLFIGNGRYLDKVTLLGGAGADYIESAGAEQANIDAGAGADTISIDTLGGRYRVTLGADSDTLVLAGTNGAFNAGQSIIVRDFQTGDTGDVLDLEAYLAGGALTNYTAGSNPFQDGHMRLVNTSAGAVLQVDRDGGANGFVNLATFSGTTASAFTVYNLGGFNSALAPINGTTDDDVLEGTSAIDTLNGLGGNDVLTGLSGGDTLNGSGGIDILIGDHQLSLYGEDQVGGQDTLNGGAGNDFLAGGFERDVLNGAGGDDIILTGSIGEVSYDAASDYFFYSYLSDRDGGYDIVDGGTGVDHALLFYGERTDDIVFNNSNNQATNQVIQLDALAGPIVSGTVTNVERITFFSGSGDDVLTGGRLTDSLNGANGDDTLYGGEGGDYLDGGLGNDNLYGGDGVDYAYYTSATSGTTVTLGLTTSQITGGAGQDFLGSIEGLVDSFYDDVFTGDAGDNGLYSYYGGDDEFYGMDGFDVLFAHRFQGPGADTILLDGGADSDLLIFRGNDRYLDTLTMIGGTGGDTIECLQVGTATIDAGDGDDRVEIDTAGGAYGITLGTGSDEIVLQNFGGVFGGSDPIVITDFEGDGIDRIDLDGYLTSGALSRFEFGDNPFATGHMRLLRQGPNVILQVEQDGQGSAWSTLITFQDIRVAAFTSLSFDGYAPDGSVGVAQMGRLSGGDDMAEWVAGMAPPMTEQSWSPAGVMASDMADIGARELAGDWMLV